METHLYASVVENWKIELLVSRARRLGFHRHDLEDAVQEIVLEVMTFEFDPQRSNGATEATALTSLVDRQLKTLLRGKRRYRRLLERAAEELQPRGDGVLEGQPAADPLEKQQLALDVQACLEQLPPRERDVCLALARGESIAAIARQLGCCWHTVRRLVSRIAQHFEAVGLDGWVRG